MSDYSQTSYRSSAASLFSCAARQSAVVQVCGWCGEPSTEPLREVEGVQIPRDHAQCASDAHRAKVFCVCFELEGDNSDCPIHGGR